MTHLDLLLFLLPVEVPLVDDATPDDPGVLVRLSCAVLTLTRAGARGHGDLGRVRGLATVAGCVREGVQTLGVRLDQPATRQKMATVKTKSNETENGDG